MAISLSLSPSRLFACGRESCSFAVGSVLLFLALAVRSFAAIALDRLASLVPATMYVFFFWPSSFD